MVRAVVVLVVKASRAAARAAVRVLRAEEVEALRADSAAATSAARSNHGSLVEFAESASDGARAWDVTDH